MTHTHTHTELLALAGAKLLGALAEHVCVKKGRAEAVGEEEDHHHGPVQVKRKVVRIGQGNAVLHAKHAHTHTQQTGARSLR